MWSKLYAKTHKSDYSRLGGHSHSTSAISALECQKNSTVEPRVLCPLFPAVLSDLQLDRSCIKTPWETQRECFRLALCEWMTFCHSPWFWGGLILPSTLNRTRLLFFSGIAMHCWYQKAIAEWTVKQWLSGFGKAENGYSLLLKSMTTGKQDTDF